jgi:hypothetical protein
MDRSQSQLPPNHNVANPSLKGPLRPSHIRARVAASPYPRDTDSVHSSSSETEDISMFLENAASEYQSIYGGGHCMAPSQEALHTTGAFGRMSLTQDHALEKLAANVRAATTTSASDRAKQIFVQAWCVFFSSHRRLALICLKTGYPQIMPHTLMGMSHVRGCIFLIVEYATSTGSPTSIPPLWARQFVYASLPLKLDV